MGNEQSKGKGQTKNGKLSMKHQNGSARGISATITPCGLEINVDGETTVQQNGGPLTLVVTESSETDYVVIKSTCPPADAQVVPPEVPVISAEVPVISAEVPVISAEVPVISAEVPVIPAEVPVISTEVPVISAEVPVISEITETQKEEATKVKVEKVKLFDKLFKKKAEPPAVVESVQEKESIEEKKESAEEKKESAEEKKERVEEKEASNEDQTDASVPAPDPQPGSGSSGDEAAAVIITEDRKDSEYLHQKAVTSTHMDKTAVADISTQTSDADDDTATNVEDPGEEDSLNESDVVIAEEAVEETANEEPSDNQTAGIITEEVIATENSAYENMVFRAERVKVTENFEVAHTKSNPAEETVNETEAEIPAEPQYQSNKFIVEAEIITEESNVEETGPSEIFSSLPKVVADCVEAVFAADPSADEVITEDNGERNRDMSDAAVLIETAEPESNAVTPEAGDANDVPSLDEEPVTTVMETISEVVCEETNPTPAKQDVPVDELSVPAATEILVMVESAKEEVIADNAVVVEDAPGTNEGIIIVEAPSNEPNTTEELLKDALNSPDDGVKSESVSKIIITDEKNAEVGEDVTADVALETAEEAEPSPTIVKDVVEVIPAAAIHALSLELSATPPQEPVVHNIILLEEEVITATTFMPLLGEREAGLTIPEKPSCETVAEEMIEEAIDALSNDLDVVQQSVEEATTVQGSTTGGDATEVRGSKEPVEEKTEVSENVLAHAESSETPEQGPAISELPSEKTAIAQLLESIPDVVIEAILERLEVTGDIVKEPLTNATGKSASCVLVQEELIDKNVPPAEVLLEGTEKETATPSVVAVREPTDSTLANIIEEPAAEQADVPLMDPTEESEPCVSVQVNIAPSEDAAAPSVVVVEDQPTDSNPVISEEPVEDRASCLENPNPCEGHATTEVLENIVESVVEATAEKLELTETIVEKPVDEQADVPPLDITAESDPCISVQEEPIEENVVPAEVLLACADKETAAPAVVVVEEPTNSNPENAVEEPADEQAGVPPVDAKVESDPCISVQEELVEENVVPAEVLLACADKETAAPAVVVVEEPTNSNPENAVEGPADEQAGVPPMVATEESAPCVSVQEEPIEENVVPAEVLLACADKETAAPAAVAVEEPTNSNFENAVEGPADEQADVPPMDGKVESDPCSSVQEEPVEENIVPAEVLLACADKETAAPAVVAVEEPTNSNLENAVEGPADEQAGVPPMDATEESAPCVSVQEEPLEKNTVPAEALLQDANKETAAPSVVAVEKPTDSNPVISGEPVNESSSFTQPKVPVATLETAEDEVTEEIVNERDNSGYVLAAIDETSKDFQVATSAKPVAKRCVEAVLETTVEEIITENVVAECTLVASEEAAPVGETKEKAGNESSVNSSDSTDSAEIINNITVPCTDMDALLVRLQSACASVVKESAYMLGDLQTSSLGNTITVTIHVAPKEVQQ